MSQIGAMFYIAWGLLHLYAAFQVYKLGKRQLAGMAQGRIYHSVWNLAAVAVAVIVAAVVYNWFHHPVGYWLHLALTASPTWVSSSSSWYVAICRCGRGSWARRSGSWR